MEKELYDYIMSKLDELSNYNISYPDDKIQELYKKLLYSGLTYDEMKERVDALFKRSLETKETEILNIKAKKGEYSNFDKITNTANIIASSDIANFLSIYGGSVPYFITGEKPKRVIGDIDLHASLDNMHLIREYIKNNSDKFEVLIDTLNYSDDDFGMELKVDGVEVSIFPIVETEKGKVVKNFQYHEALGQIDEKATLFYGLTEENSTINSSINGKSMKMECPEYIYIQKSIALREKDRIDLTVLNNIVDQDKINYLKKITKKPDVIVNKVININGNNSENLVK